MDHSDEDGCYRHQGRVWQWDLSFWEYRQTPEGRLFHIWYFNYHETIEYVEYHGDNVLVVKFRETEMQMFLSDRINGRLRNSPAGLRGEGPAGPQATGCSELLPDDRGTEQERWERSPVLLGAGSGGNTVDCAHRVPVAVWVVFRHQGRPTLS